MRLSFSYIKRIYLSALVGIIWVSVTGQTHPGVYIDPRVLEDTVDGKTARFLVVFDQPLTFRQIADQEPQSNEEVGRMINRLRNNAINDQVIAKTYLDQNAVEYRAYWVANAIAIYAGRKVVDYMANLPGVVLIEPDRSFAVDLEVINSQTDLVGGNPEVPLIQPNLNQVHAPQVWAGGSTGYGTVYAVADTGVYWQHEALISQYRGWNGVDVTHDYNWWDAIHTDINGAVNPCGYDVDYPCDDYGHGTHVTGIGVGDDGHGIQIGVAPDARWIACRNMDSGVGRPSTYIECLQFFIAPTDLAGNNANPSLRPDVISNSYACPDTELCDTHALKTAVENVRAAGIFMSVSAGNDGSACETIIYPPALEQTVFTVGAVNASTNIAGFSSRGPVTADLLPLMKPNIVAPGVSIYSSTADGGYGFMSGTSMAAPHVAGAVSLLWGTFPSLRRDVAATEALLAKTAQPLTTTEGCGGDGYTQVPNNTYGWGLLDVQKAYLAAFWSIQPKYIFPLIFK